MPADPPSTDELDAYVRARLTAYKVPKTYEFLDRLAAHRRRQAEPQRAGGGTRVIEYDPYSADVKRDPYPYYRALRDDAPAYHHEELDFWALSRFDDVIEALHDPATYCSGEGIVLEAMTRSPYPMIIALDPPRHTDLRKLVSRAFGTKPTNAFEPQVRERRPGADRRVRARGPRRPRAELQCRTPARGDRRHRGRAGRRAGVVPAPGRDAHVAAARPAGIDRGGQGGLGRAARSVHRPHRRTTGRPRPTTSSPTSSRPRRTVSGSPPTRSSASATC